MRQLDLNSSMVISNMVPTSFSIGTNDTANFASNLGEIQMPSLINLHVSNHEKRNIS